MQNKVTLIQNKITQFYTNLYQIKIQNKTIR